jgi:hypothetical protein
MQTLERTDALDSSGGGGRGIRRSRAFAFGSVLVVLVVVSAAVGYGVASGRTRTRTVLRTAPAPTTAPARNCIPGAAPGSCNTDEFIEQKIPDVPLDAPTRATLAQQLVAARNAAMRYPTVADARAAGMIQAGGFSPETGAHFIARDGGVGAFDASHPGAYIYDGVNPTSKVVGLMYMSLTVPLTSFAGPNDHWHRHSNPCVQFANGEIEVPFAADSDVTAAQCSAVQGTFMKRTTWMVHAWVVPGWESPLGVFSHDNPDLVCANGSTKGDAAGFCQGT